MPDDEQPVAWIESVQLVGAEEMVPVRLQGRAANRVLLRQVDPGEPAPSRIPIYRADEVVVMQAISHLGIHDTDDPSNKYDLLFAMRVVPVRQEGNIVYARTLRYGERDTGERVHVPPGGQVVFENGAVRAELEYIDSLQQATLSGYVPLTPVLWSWLRVATFAPSTTRYVLAAARRLDIANELLMDVQRLEDEVNADEGMKGPDVRRRLFLLIGSVEMAIVALGRAFAMITRAPESVRGSIAIPASLRAAAKTVKAIRDAYEHIEDRAFGNVFGEPDPQALTIFEYDELLASDRIVYAGYSLDLKQELPGLLAEARECLKSFVRSVEGPASD